MPLLPLLAVLAFLLLLLLLLGLPGWHAVQPLLLATPVEQPGTPTAATAIPIAPAAPTPPPDAGTTVSGGRCSQSATRWFSVAAHFTSHMVLQRAAAACVWGAASHAGASLTVALANDGRVVAAQPSRARQAGSAIRWEACLGPLDPQATRGPLLLEVQSSDPGRCRRIRLVDIMIGDVLLCSGQSNMWFPMQSQVPKAKLTFPNPLIRTLLVAEAGSPVPSPELRVEASGDAMGPAWTPALSFAHIRKFSAVCYLAAQRLLDLLPGSQRLPLGLVSAAARDQAIHVFLPPPPAPLPCGTVVSALTRRGAFWNSFFAPLTGTALAAVLWYQGESDTRSPPGYSCKLAALIEAWRRSFRSRGGPLPVLAVSLHAYHCRRPLGNALIRQQQLDVAAAVSNVSLVPAFDSWPTVLSHPPDKTLVARRAAALLAADLHNIAVPHRGPRLLAVTVAATPGENASALRLLYDTACPSPHHMGGSSRGPACFKLCVGHECEPHGPWEPSAAVNITGHMVTLRLQRSVSLPLHLRYAFGNQPTCFLYSQDGWPAMPFWVTLNATRFTLGVV